MRQLNIRLARMRPADAATTCRGIHICNDRTLLGSNIPLWWCYQSTLGLGIETDLTNRFDSYSQALDLISVWSILIHFGYTSDTHVKYKSKKSFLTDAVNNKRNPVSWYFTIRFTGFFLGQKWSSLVVNEHGHPHIQYKLPYPSELWVQYWQ